MTGKLASFLGDDDVKYLTTLIGSLESSGVDFFELKVGDLQVRLGKGEPPAIAQPAAPVPVAPAPAAAASPLARPAPTTATPAPAAAPEAPVTVAAPAEPVPMAAPSDAGLEIVAPLMGVFYAQPEPGAPAFVAAGTHVTSETTVGLIEVMKTFAPVPAGVTGTILEVCVRDSELVEFGQRLFVVRPDDGE